MKPMRTTRLIIKNLWRIAFIVVVVTLLSCNGKEAAPAAKVEDEHHEDASAVELTKAQFATAGITLGKIETRALSGTIQVNGMLDVPPQNLVSICAPLGGFLKSTDLLQGKPVKKGEAIAVVENTEYIQLQQDYLDFKSQLEFMEAEYKRQEELARENVNAQKTLQQAKSQYQSTLAKVNGLKAKLQIININPEKLSETGDVHRTITLYSPISGFVTEVNANIGMYVSPTDVMFRIVDTKHLHAELIVFEKDITKLKIGQKVRFTLANESQERMATIYLIGREITEQRTVRIHCHLDQEDTDLLPGMYLTALVETGGNKVPSLPDESIVDFEGKKYIFVSAQEDDSHEHTKGEEEGHHFKMLEVKTGLRELGYTEVILSETLSSEAEVVLKGAYDLLSKMKNSEEEGGHVH